MSLHLYYIDINYANELSKIENKIPFFDKKDSKNERPLVGIVLTINEINYYSPLSSPKPKHKKMKNQIDFRLISNGEYGVINFNNMVPVPNKFVKKINLDKLPNQTNADKQYIQLLINQLSWLNKENYKKRILKQAKRLYDVIQNKHATKSLLERCCDYHALEIIYNEKTNDH